MGNARSTSLSIRSGPQRREMAGAGGSPSYAPRVREGGNDGVRRALHMRADGVDRAGGVAFERRTEQRAVLAVDVPCQQRAHAEKGTIALGMLEHHPSQAQQPGRGSVEDGRRTWGAENVAEPRHVRVTTEIVHSGDEASDGGCRQRHAAQPARLVEKGRLADRIGRRAERIRHAGRERASVPRRNPHEGLLGFEDGVVDGEREQRRRLP
ncbi:hypothetical protein IMF23_11675 [Chelatococcus daeguensis]|uniref:hypothetical protein n=1 Tax=Chelatococcus daeguensis TaxID=444444 RepID=UPI000B112123|nr:hypothetical protein [Chelatococcus daeguensis]MBM3084097.1 hypothetical protein [Chelatococcus daeguensis]